MKIKITLTPSTMRHNVSMEYTPGSDDMVLVVADAQSADQWRVGIDDPGITVQQAEILGDLLRDVGLVLDLEEDGTLTVNGD